VAVFLTGSQEAKFMAWKRLLDEARRHDRAFEQVEQEEARVKEKKRARSAESSESSESEDPMQTAFIEEGATWETVKVKFPGCCHYQTSRKCCMRVREGPGDDAR
jgi:hypothetical protein